MTSQVLNDTNLVDGEEGDTTFNFDKWIDQNGLQSIKDAFIDKDMTTLNTINMSNNKNFSALMADYRILQNTDLIPKMVDAIQSLEPLREKQNTTKLVYMTKDENMTLQQIQKYIKNMNELNDEFKTMNDEYENKKVYKNNKTKIYQNLCNKQLNNMSNIITKNIGKLHETVNKKENMLKKKINGYKKEVENIKLNENKTENELDHTLNKIHETIKKEQQHFEEKMVLCENVIKKYGNSYDDVGSSERQNELKKIGNEAEQHYNAKMKEINEDKAKITGFLNIDTIKDDEKDSIYSIDVNENIYNDIWHDIDNYITLHSKNDADEENQGTVIKEKLISELLDQVASTQKKLEQSMNSYKTLQSEMNEKKTEHERNKSKLRKEISSLQSQVQMLQSQNDNKLKQMNSKKQENIELKNSINDKIAIIDQLKVKNVSLNATIKSMQETEEKKQDIPVNDIANELDVDKLVQFIRVTETAEQYEDMCELVKKLIKLKSKKSQNLDTEERNLFSVAYKNVVGQLRASWRTISGGFDDDDVDEELLNKYKISIENKLEERCREVIALLKQDILKNVEGNNDEQEVFYLKMCGDFYRFIAEFKTHEDTVKNSSERYYQKAMDVAEQNLAETHPTRLGLALNFCVCYYQILGEKEKACDLAKRSFDAAIEKLDTLTDRDYKDSTLIMQLLRDNLTLWTSANDDD